MDILIIIYRKFKEKEYINIQILTIWICFVLTYNRFKYLNLCNGFKFGDKKFINHFIFLKPIKNIINNVILSPIQIIIGFNVNNRWI